MIEPGCMHQRLSSIKAWTIHILGFVDDKCHCVNKDQKQLKTYILQLIEKSVRTWDELLQL